MASGSYFDPGWVEKVTLPVRLVEGRWEFFYGGPIPVRDEALGELTLCADFLTDKDFRRKVTQEVEVQILEEGAPLMIALSDPGNDGGRIGRWPDFGPGQQRVPHGTTRFEQVWLGPKRELLDDPLHPAKDELRGGLWLRLKGIERSELFGSSVRLPEGLKQPYAFSLNHAYTVLSQAFETHRISNTGNVYTKVFYQDHDRLWYPLDDLRLGVQAQAERRLLHGLWQKVEQILGWRPPPPPPSRKR